MVTSIVTENIRSAPVSAVHVAMATDLRPHNIVAELIASIW